MNKKETLDEAAEREYKFEEDSTMPDDREHQEFKRIFKKGAKWQAERMYSEEEVKKLIVDFLFTKRIGREVGSVKEWFEKHKKKQNEK